MNTKRAGNIPTRWRLIVSFAAFVLALAIASPLIHAQQSGPVPTGAGTFGPPISTVNGHVSFGGGAAPTINPACGTAPVAPSGTDSAYSFTSGTATSTACAITPAIGWNRKPTCSVESQGGTSPTFQVATNGIIVLSGVADSTVYSVICIGQPGG